MAEKSMTELLKDKGVPKSEINKYLTYLADAERQEAAAKRKDANKNTPVTNNTPDQRYKLFLKYWNLGLTIDGTDIVITGNSMAMVTYHGYRNKVLKVYPEAQIDVGLVREGDDFQISKESGQVLYHHNVVDPFGSGKIKGAYMIVKTKRGEQFEALGLEDYTKMKNQSKQSSLWDKWPSEFWLKSVAKRGFKRHFNDAIEDLDKLDNEQYGGVEVDEAIARNDAEVDAAIAAIDASMDQEQLKTTFMELGKLRVNKQVVAAKDRKKAFFQEEADRYAADHDQTPAVADNVDQTTEDTDANT